jgi:hypothetical protein
MEKPMSAATNQDFANETRSAIKGFAILGSFFFAAALGIYLYGLNAGRSIPRDGSSLVVGRDFLDFWMYGRAAALPDPSTWYDAAPISARSPRCSCPAIPDRNGPIRRP